MHYGLGSVVSLLVGTENRVDRVLIQSRPNPQMHPLVSSSFGRVSEIYWSKLDGTGRKHVLEFGLRLDLKNHRHAVRAPGPVFVGENNIKTRSAQGWSISN
ncbi:MAG: hypothetical protein GY820_14170 [Gammaproteobacteria bacterium]|nr:hypothetical protein [Gammaproteobacteria bacterium]